MRKYHHIPPTGVTQWVRSWNLLVRYRSTSLPFLFFVVSFIFFMNIVYILNDYEVAVWANTNKGINMNKVQEPYGSLLVLMSVKIQDEKQIAKEINWINEDYNAVCAFYSVCHWQINVVVSTSALITSFQDRSFALPQSISYRFTTFSKPFNKFEFVGGFIDQMTNYDSVLIKDNDQRITSFSWRTFVTKSSNAVMSGPLRRSSGECSERRQVFQFHEACHYESFTRPEWSADLVDNEVPVEVTFLEMYFVFMDAKFANFFFNLALRPSLLHKSSAWGIDFAWCAAAKAWNDGLPGCYLIPVNSTHEDTRQIKKDQGHDDNGNDSVEKFKADSIIGSWMEESSTWRKIVGGHRSLNRIERKCRHLLRLNATDSFDLQTCATRAGGIIQGDEGHKALKLIGNELGKNQPEEDFLMLNKANRILADRLRKIKYDNKWGGFLHDETIAIVTGAGSKEVDGCYIVKNSIDNDIFVKFSKIDNSNSAKRTFEMSKSKEGRWWNIIESVENSYSNPVHYYSSGSEIENSILPPADGWSNKRKELIGMDPMPKVEVLNRKTCEQVEKHGDEDMPAKFSSSFNKIYVYPAPPNQSPEDIMHCIHEQYPGKSVLDDKYGLVVRDLLTEDVGEWYLHEQMKGSHLLTADASEADFFVVNTMPVLSKAVNNCNGMDHRQRQQYWKRLLLNSTVFKSHPRNHIFICQTWYCGRIITHLRKLVEKMTYLIHEKNVEWALPKESRGFFSTSQILTIPYVAHSGIVPFTTIQNPPKREHKVTFIGSMRRRTKWRKPLLSLRRVNIHDAGAQFQNFVSNYSEEMMRSTFCLVVQGDTASTRRLFDAMIAGCIPVFVGPELYDRPFEDMIPYDSFSLRFDEFNYMGGNPQLEVDKLWNVSQEEIDYKRNKMSHYIKFIDWRHGNSTASLA